MKVAVIGLGLMGGSFLKASQGFDEVVVYISDLREEAMGLAQETYGAKRLSEAVLGEIDLFLICLKPQEAINWVLAHKDRLKKGAIISDICGVKLPLEQALKAPLETTGLIYAPIHPMAGREVGGYENSRESLYQGAYLIVSEVFWDKVLSEAKWRAYFDYLGFKGYKVATSQRHDEMIAYTSQLAHLVSNAFVSSPQALDHQGYSADSLKDLTRVATMDTKMWTELFLLNKDNLVREMTCIIERLEEMKQAIQDEDGTSLKALLDEGVEKKGKMYAK